MTLKAADVAEIMRLVEESSFDELTLEIDGLKLSLRRGAAGMVNGAAADGVPWASSQGASAAAGSGAGGFVPAAAGQSAGSGVGAQRSAPAVTSGSSGSGTAAAGAQRGAAPSGSIGAGGRAHALTNASGAPAAEGGGAAHASGASAAPRDPNLHDVAAPLLGTFYRSPKPGAPPFVDIGATVEEDTVVGIIEVMKLMNTVRAGVRGTVTEIFAKDGALVEYDETILRVRKAG